MDARNRLTAKEKNFVEQYFKTNNGTASAIAAGYSTKSAALTANHALKRPHVMYALEQLNQARREALAVSGDTIGDKQDAIIKGLFEIAANSVNSATSRVSAYATLAKYIIESKSQGTNKLSFTLNIGDTNLLQVADEPKGIDAAAYDVEGEVLALSEDNNQ